MKAVVYSHYGPPEVLRIEEVPTPVPGEREILVRTYATTVNSGDWRVRSLDVPFGFRLLSRLALGVTGPRNPILGSELAGEVVAVGSAARNFKVGDPVIVFSGVGLGCHAEYKCMPDDGRVVRKPSNLSFDEAAALAFGGSTALHFLQRAGLARGEKLLVNGASGTVGTTAVQLARHFGAEVTAVCSGANADLVRRLGADHVIDYTREDFAAGGTRYDLIMDTAGTAPWPRAKHALADGGRLLVVLGGLPDMLRIPWVRMTRGIKVIAGPAAERLEDLRLLATLAESGAYRPVIDRRYPFEQIVEAHRYVDSGRKRGSVVVTLAPPQ